MIRICHLSTVHSATDHRLLNKECVSLSKAGYDVHLIARAEEDSLVNGVQIHAFPDYSNRFLRATVGVVKIGIEAYKLRPRVVHFHDPEILWITPFLWLLRIKLIYDSHEHFPKQVTSKPWLKPKLLRLLLSRIVAVYEFFYVLFVKRVISVTPEIVNRFPLRKRCLVRNFPILFSTEPKNITLPRVGSDHIPVAIYVGGLTRLRGIKEIVDVFSRLESKCELRLFGPWESEEFKDFCLRSCSDNVFYMGVRQNEEIAEELLKADIGLALLYPVKNYLMSYPVKAFEYMSASLPIVMSDFPYWEKLFEGAAIFVNPKAKNEIYKAILVLIEDKNRRIEMGSVGLRMVKTEYNWESEAKKLVQLYANL